MVYRGADLDARLLDYLRWITHDQNIPTLTDAWNQWRAILPQEMFKILGKIEDVWSFSDVHERERMIAHFPLSSINTVLPESVSAAALYADTSTEDREVFRRYIMNVALIAASLRQDIRNALMHAVIPVHVERSLRDSIRTSPEYVTGLYAATREVPVPRPKQRRHTTTVRIPSGVHHVDWSIVINPYSGDYHVQWKAVRKAIQHPVLRRAEIPLEALSEHVTLVVEPESYLQEAQYHPVTLEALRQFADKPAVPITLYDNGMISQKQLAHATPLLAVRVLPHGLECVPLTERVLTLIY